MNKGRASFPLLAWGIFLLAVVSLVIFWNNYRTFREFKIKEIQKSISLQKQAVNERLEMWRLHLKLLVVNPYILDSVISSGDNEGVHDKIVRYLQDIVVRSNWLTIFLMNDAGQCVISSDPRFEGENYGFRPYFKQAMEKGRGQYIALGVTSGRLGLYLSSRVKTYLGDYGVLVVKADPYLLLGAIISDRIKGLDVWGCTESGVFFSSEKTGFYHLRGADNHRRGRQFEKVSFKTLDITTQEWALLKSRHNLEIEIEGRHYITEYVPLIPGVMSLFCVISDDFSLPTLEYFKNSLLLTSIALFIFLLSIIHGVFFLRQQYFVIAKEKKKKRESESRYRAIIQGNRDGFVVMDPDTLLLLEVNRQFCAMLDIDREEEVVNKYSFMEFITPDDQPLFRNKLSSTAEIRYFVFKTEIEKDGIAVPVIIDFVKYQDDEGTDAFCYAFIEDISRGLRDANRIKLLETAVEQSGSSIIITDAEGYIQYVNPAFTKISGFEENEVLGKKSNILRSGEHDKRFYKELWETILAENVWHGRFCNKRKDGDLFWEDATIAPVHDDSGRLLYFIAIKNDVTKLVALEDVLEQKIMELESIMAHAGIGIGLVQNRKIVMVNRNVAEMFSASVEDVVGKSTSIFFDSEEEYQAFGERCYPDLLMGKSVSFELEKYFPDGKFRWLQITATAINPGDMETMRTVWVCHDITRLKDLQLELEESREKAEYANRAKSLFLANMSHEIRTPLNGIIGMLALISGSQLDEQQKQYLNTARLSAETLLGLINDILDISKIEAGKLEMEEREFSLYMLMEETAAVFALSVKQKGITFDVEYPDDIPECFLGDPDRLRQIFFNLAGNAVKFTEKGGVVLRVESVKDIGDGRMVVKIEVEDSGIGIPKDRIDRLFKTFSQVDSSISRRFGGTGLGLVISRSIVEMMGGEMGVLSMEGEGSTFWFTVVLGRSDLSEEECKSLRDIAVKPATAFEDTSISFKGRVLVVDDNVVNREVVVGLLSRFGISTDTVENGRDAVDVLSTLLYDLVMMDIQMPIMDGIEATKLIRDRHSDVMNHDVPVIALTAHAFNEEMQRCKAAGMNGYLTKPINVIHLVEELKRWLPFEDVVPDKAASRQVDAQNVVSEDVSVSTDVAESDVDVEPFLFDRSDLLDRTIGDVQLAASVINMFIESSRELMDTLKSAIDDELRDDVRKSAHTLKGAAANVGSAYISSIALELEKNSTSESVDALRGYAERLSDALGAFVSHPDVNELLKNNLP